MDGNKQREPIYDIICEADLQDKSVGKVCPRFLSFTNICQLHVLLINLVGNCILMRINSIAHREMRPCFQGGLLSSVI